MGNIRRMIVEGPSNIHGRIIDHHVILDIVGDDVHFWSPQLNFRVEKDPDDSTQTIVAGLIGPRPGVWTLFMFVYFSIALAGFVISSIGVSKWLLGGSSLLIWAMPVAILFMLTAYQAGKFGENMAADQIEQLKQFVRDAIRTDQ